MSYSNPYQAASESFYPSSPETLKQSGLGIASFAIGLAAGVLEFLCIVGAGALEVSTPGGIDKNSPVVVMIGLAILAGFPVALFGIGLGIAGLFQRRKKVFSVLGIVMNILVILGVALILVVGTMAGA